MSQESKKLHGLADRALGKQVTRRRLMGTSAAALTAAAFAGGPASSAFAGGASGQTGRAVTNQDEGSPFNGAWPYQAPPTGHFNSFVTDGILNPPNIYGDLITLPFGLYYWQDQEWMPLLATEWGFADEENFQLTIREDVVWSDGAPFSTDDVLATFSVLRLMSNTVWQYIDEVTAVDESTVNFHMSVPSTVVERYVIRMSPRPAATYGEWAAQADELFAGGLTVQDDEGAQLLEQFTAFRPEAGLANGPYIIDIESISNAEMTLVKNETGYLAADVPFDTIRLYNGETDTITAVVLNKDVDYATHGFAPASEQEFLANDIRVLRPPIYSGPALLMNFATLGDAFGDKRARQGIAHAMDGDEIGFFSLAESGVKIEYQTGVSDNIITGWLSEEDLGALNAYAPDPDQAAVLLEEAGWTRDGDAWMTPAGEPAAFELMFPAEFADWSAAGQTLAQQLTDFGIAVEPRAVTFTQVGPDVNQGNFQLAIQAWGSSTNPHPHFGYVQAFFTNNTLAINDGGAGIDFPLEQTTDVAGDVDLNALVVSSAEGLDEGAQGADILVMAQVFNELLPKIPLFERYGNNSALEGVRVAAWPADDDPILVNSPYADGIVTMLLLSGDLQPV